MSDSEDTRKRNDWTINPFERVNHSTNFEDLAISSSDEHHFYGSDDHSDHKPYFKPMDGTQHKNEPITHSFKINLKPHKFEPKTISPIITTSLAVDHKDNSFVDSCISAGNSSAEVTPAGTPQSSPYSIRKVMDNKKTVNAMEKKNALSANPKRWFYTGFFNADANSGQQNAMTEKPQIPRNPSFKNLCVSNFDINAVGPTSW